MLKANKSMHFKRRGLPESRLFFHSFRSNQLAIMTHIQGTILSRMS
jgi:hypothetical protein